MRIEADLPRLAPILKKLAAISAGEEVAGFIRQNGEVAHSPNLAAALSREFDIGALHDLEDGNVRALWHTHPEDQPPSAADVENCRATAVPWLIAGPTKLWCIHPTPPSLYGLEFHRNEAFQLWVLHVWLYRENPSGMFSDWNPTVSCAAVS